MTNLDSAARVAATIFWLEQAGEGDGSSILLVPPHIRPDLLLMAREFQALLAKNCELQTKLRRKGRAGRKPEGDRPLTNAEIVSRYRAKKKRQAQGE